MFELGDVLKVKWDERPIRVIMVDPFETFYDVLWAEGIGWGLERARTAIYYRIPTDFLANGSSKLRSEPLSEKELSKHRPDLPFRLLRNDRASWPDDNLEEKMQSDGISIDAKQLAILPFGVKGATLKAQKIQCSNGRFFTGAELLSAAKHAQEAICPEVVGVGLYRLGISGGIPSYYLWGATDRAGHAT